jgi:hypothetical protein
MPGSPVELLTQMLDPAWWREEVDANGEYTTTRERGYYDVVGEIKDTLAAREGKSRESLHAEVDEERERQDAKWGGVPGVDRRNDDTFAAVLGEEFGEVCKEWLECSPEKMRVELIQVAAVALSWVEELDNGGMRARVFQGPDWEAAARTSAEALLALGPLLPPRLPCPEDPALLAGAPIGMYHCPVCGMMVMAALPHPAPDDDYEAEYGRPWPAGYAA